MKRSRLKKSKSKSELVGFWNSVRLENDSLPEAIERHKIEHKFLGFKE